MPKPSFISAFPLLLVGLLCPISVEAQHTKESAPTEYSDWPLPRGDALSTARAPQTLAQDLAVRWEFEAEEAIETTPVVKGKRVVVADVMGSVYALDRDRGQQIWRHDFDTGFLASPAIQDNIVVVGDIEGNLVTMDLADGKILWKKTLGGEINGSAGFHQDSVLATSQDGQLYCFDLRTGQLRWTYLTDDQIRCSPTIAGNHTFLGGCDGRLHVVDLNTGKADGEPIPLGGPTGSTPAVKGTHVFLPIMDGVVLAFDYVQRKELWHYEDPDRPQEYRNSAALSDSLVIVSSQYKQVDAISTANGKRVWRHTLRRRADASPVIAGDDVWIASTDGRLIRLSVADGKEKWSYEIRGGFYGSPAIAGSELFIADDEGVVRCFAPEREPKSH